MTSSSSTERQRQTPLNQRPKDYQPESKEHELCCGCLFPPLRFLIPLLFVVWLELGQKNYLLSVVFFEIFARIFESRNSGPLFYKY